MRTEPIIRDWLAENLGFIDEELKLVGKEYYLADKDGSSGYIDILCTDIFNNHVIIEIKRSDTAARQTFTEVFKYAGLIKEKYGARNSEIRIVIIATDWNEILRAYSFAAFDSPFAIKGYKLTLDRSGTLPVNIEEMYAITATVVADDGTIEHRFVEFDEGAILPMKKQDYASLDDYMKTNSELMKYFLINVASVVASP